MEIVLAILIVILILILRSNVLENSKLLEHLNDKVQSLSSEINALKKSAIPPPIIEEKALVNEILPEVEDVVVPPVEIVVEEKIIPVVQEAPVSTTDNETADLLAAVQQIRGKNERVDNTYEKLSWWDKWLSNNPDIEKFIGENLINKIGIAVLVLGISFFVKYAIDQDWINETGRVCIGLVSGGILVAFAHRLRNSYRSFSSVLVGGGLAVFYFSIAYAFHQYHLLSQTAAFVVMVVITAFAILLSILYNRIELAVLATVGGFITPFLVSTGSGNYIVLFTYICILNTGLIVLAYFKNWRLLHFLAFFFTLIIYSGWLFNLPYDKPVPFKGAFFFATLFYVLFVVMNMMHHIVKGSKLLAFDFIILLSINFSFYAAGMYLLDTTNYVAYQGLFTLVIGTINLLIAYSIFKKNAVDKNFVFLLIGLTLTFISLAAPVQLDGNYITIFWAAETVVLLWLYQQSFIKLLKIAALLIYCLCGISLFIDWINVYHDSSTSLAIIFNNGFITSVVVAIALLLNYRLLKKEADTFYLPAITHQFLRSLYLLTAIVVLFIAGALEIWHQFAYHLPNTGFAYTYLQLYIVLFVYFLFIVMNKFKMRQHYSIQPIIVLLLFMLYCLNTQNSYQAEIGVLTKSMHQWYFLAHVVAVCLLLVLMYKFIQHLRLHKIHFQSLKTELTCLISVAYVIIFSVEFQHLYIWVTWQNVALLERFETHYYKAGLSIVWGISSFAMIWLGMKYRFKMLRIIALILFGITLIKLFVYDISNIAPGGKIAAFILLGVLLLVVSFMYQRLKKIIIDDANTKN